MNKPVVPPVTLWLRTPPIDDALRARLAHGARLREEMRAQIDAGKKPGPAYRVEWLRETAKEIVLLLARKGEEFNAAHPEDAISLGDVLDALATARMVLLTMAPNGFEDMGRDNPCERQAPG